LAVVVAVELLRLAAVVLAVLYLAHLTLRQILFIQLLLVLEAPHPQTAQIHRVFL
jgi:hypothetical protein